MPAQHNMIIGHFVIFLLHGIAVLAGDADGHMFTPVLTIGVIVGIWSGAGPGRNHPAAYWLAIGNVILVSIVALIAYLAKRTPVHPEAGGWHDYPFFLVPAFALLSASVGAIVRFISYFIMEFITRRK